MTRILANRLHHTAYVTKDLEATRAFYEDVLGFPLMATYCEKDELFGKERTYCHVFFELADGSALAFFQFADPEDQAEFGPEMPAMIPVASDSGLNSLELFKVSTPSEPDSRRLGRRSASAERVRAIAEIQP